MDDDSKQAERKKRNRLLLYTAIAAILILIFFYYSENSLLIPNADKEIAKMEAERFVPDEENAAIVYNKLFKIYDPNSFRKATTGFEITDYIGRPWKSEDYPREAEWLEQQKHIIGLLSEAAGFEKCYFPFQTDSKEFEVMMDNMATLRNLTHFLIMAANNDAGEGRIDEAIEKNRYLIKIAGHMQQQPLLIEYLVGIAIEAYGLKHTKMIIIESDINSEQLAKIEELQIPTANEWESKSDKLKEAEYLFALKKTNLVGALFARKTFETTLEQVKETYNRLLGIRRAIYIIIELKKYKDKNGNWPAGLEDIKGNLDAEIFIDPQSGDGFVYKVTEEEFTLYSKGPDNIDEGGDTGDDWLIWPER